MKPVVARAVRTRMRDQHGVVTRAQLRGIGVTPSELRTRLQAGEWVGAGRRLVRAAAFPPSHEQRVWEAVLEAGPGAVVSHHSAAWLWGFADPPRRHAVTVPRATRYGGAIAVWHRGCDSPARTLLRRGLPCTDPLRTLVDLAGVCARPELDDFIDRALTTKLVTIAGIDAELQRRARRGRPGIGALRAALRERGLAGAPSPSVLESRFLRLLHRAGLRPMATEVRTGPEGRYRIDTQMTANVAVEVDGHAYHASPEQKAEDERRRNRLRLDGLMLLVYTWRDVSYEPHRVIQEVREAIRLDRPATAPRRA